MDYARPINIRVSREDVASISRTIFSSAGEVDDAPEVSELPRIDATAVPPTRSSTDSSLPLTVNVDFTGIIPTPPNSFRRPCKQGFSRGFVGRRVHDTTLGASTHRKYLEATAEERMLARAEKRRMREEEANKRMLRELEAVERRMAKKRMREERAKKRELARQKYFEDKATEIQRIVRGKLGRNEAYRKQIFDQQSSFFLTNMRLAREAEEKAKAQWQLEHRHAILIQCMSRRHLSKRRLNEKRAERDCALGASAARVQNLYRKRLHRRHAAATALQRQRRGYAARQEAARIRAEMCKGGDKRTSSILIQALMRGRMGRKKQAKKKRASIALQRTFRRFRRRKKKNKKNKQEKTRSSQQHNAIVEEPTGYTDDEFEDE